MRDRDLEFFRPLWRRLATTVFCLVWAAMEWAAGESLWGTLAGGLFLVCVWKLLFTFDETLAAAEQQRSDNGDSPSD